MEIIMKFGNITSDKLEKYVSEAETLKKEIFESVTDVHIKGTAYYISNDGNDENDGLSPESAWKTVTRANACECRPGDALLFRRGDFFRVALDENARGDIMLREGVTYSAFGSGAKPILNFALDASSPESWSPTENENIWAYKRRLPGVDTDIGCIVINGGNAWGIKVSLNSVKNTRMFIGRVSNGLEKFDAPEEPAVKPYLVHRDLEFYHSWEDDTVYMYSSKGNPGERFDSVELCPKRHGFWGDVKYATVDNLELFGAGAHGIGTANTVGVTVSYCVFRYIGGSIQGPSSGGNDPVRFGNAVENWSNCRDFRIHHCFATQVYDCCWTTQWCGRPCGEDVIFENIEFDHNVTEYSNNGLEVWLGASNDDGTYRFEIRNMKLHHNYTLYSGYGWSHQRPNKDANFFYGGLGETTTRFIDCNISENVGVLTTCYAVFARAIGPEQFNFNHNVYVMPNGKRYALTAGKPLDGTGELLNIPFGEEGVKLLEENKTELGSEFYTVCADAVKPCFEDQ